MLVCSLFNSRLTPPSYNDCKRLLLAAIYGLCIDQNPIIRRALHSDSGLGTMLVLSDRSVSSSPRRLAARHRHMLTGRSGSRQITQDKINWRRCMSGNPARQLGMRWVRKQPFTAAWQTQLIGTRDSCPAAAREHRKWSEHASLKNMPGTKN